MNPRTKTVSRLLCSLILCLWVFFTAQSVKADAILVGSGFGETADAFHALVLHGAVNPGVGGVHMLTSQGAISWNIELSIAEIDGGKNFADFVTVSLVAQHLVGVHAGEKRNDAITLTVSTPLTGPFKPGDNPVFTVKMIKHLPIADHTDQFSATLTFTVANDGLSITGYKLEVFGAHCSPQCPVIPPIDKQLKEVPEWNTLMLFGSGLVGLLGYNWRRKKEWLRQRT